ncbi:MAG TPA: hypothetical protein VMF64_04735 [Steroidobacteraceae bacterium]|nr:hypothetical protein [Steroidobacteraceae bacterium]
MSVTIGRNFTQDALKSTEPLDHHFMVQRSISRHARQLQMLQKSNGSPAPLSASNCRLPGLAVLL